jgi:glutaredoxin 3
MIEIYTMNHCPYCVKAKSILTQHGLTFKEIHIQASDEAKRTELMERSGMRTLPQIFFNEKCIGGCTDLEALALSDGLRSIGASNSN